jgi:hypothetical protein
MDMAITMARQCKFTQPNLGALWHFSRLILVQVMDCSTVREEHTKV